MWTSPKTLGLPSQPRPPSLARRPISAATPHRVLSRRRVAIHANSLLLLVLRLPPPSRADAQLEPRKSRRPVEPEAHDDESEISDVPCRGEVPTAKAFLDISIDGEPAGRITVELYGDTSPTGASRFGDLVGGAAGFSYRRKEFAKITPNYVRHGGARSQGAGGGRSGTAELIEEWERADRRCWGGTRNTAGAVSIIVRDPSKPPPERRLVAERGRLEIREVEAGAAPDGTEFVIAVRDAPELDPVALVVGRVAEGMEVVERIAQVKTVPENSGSPYFRMAKLFGDKRAIVAERGFNRPFSKVLITDCGLMK